MTMTPRDPELALLLNEYVNGEITVERLASLEVLLRGSGFARDEYRSFMRVHSGLSEFVDELTDRGELSERVNEEPPRRDATAGPGRRRWRVMAVLTTCVLAVCVTVLFSQRPRIAGDRLVGLAGAEAAAPSNTAADSLEPPHREASRPVAIIARMAGVVMAPGAESLQVGQGLRASRVSIQSGLLQLDFLNGVSVILEGASDFELKSENRGKLRQGRVRVYAPSPEDGFIVETNQAMFVDRGTEFGVQASADGQAELHVFDGQVDVLPGSDGKAPHSVTSGQALAILPDRQWQEIRVRPERFPSLSNVSERLLEQISQRHHEWQQTRNEILNDDDLVAYFDFEADSENAQRVANRGKGGLDGIVVGCNRAQGRWPGKTAIEFKRPHDRVRINIPGEFRSLTLAVWMRLDGFDRKFNSILLTDIFEDGQVHWQVRADGKIDMGIKPGTAKRLLYLSDSLLGFEDLGRWIQLVSVIDRPRGFVVHYLDGREVTRVGITRGRESQPRPPVEEPFDIRIGRAELGNWNPRDVVDSESIRNLNGRIDEFFVFSRGLEESEVSRLYEIGRP